MKTDKKLVKLLNSVIEKNLTKNKESDLYEKYIFRLKNTDEDKELLIYLQNNKEYDAFDDKIQYCGSNGSRVTIEQLMLWLVNRANITDSETAVGDLLLYLETNEAILYEVDLLIDVTLSEPYSFYNGITLYPYEKIPNSSLVNLMHRQIFGNFLPYPKCYSALLLSFKQKGKEDAKNFFERMNKIDELKVCMSLVSENGINSFIQGTIAPENVPIIDSFGCIRSKRHEKPMYGTKFGHFELDKINRLLKSFVLLSNDNKKHLTIAVSKLNDYYTRKNTVDSLISLRICLESIFLSDDHKEQITYTLSLRGAQFLGKDLEEKKNIRRLIKQVYNITSHAVHRGKYPKNKKGLEKIPIVASYAKEALKRLIINGFVDWEEIELGHYRN